MQTPTSRLFCTSFGQINSMFLADIYSSSKDKSSQRFGTSVSDPASAPSSAPSSFPAQTTWCLQTWTNHQCGDSPCQTRGEGSDPRTLCGNISGPRSRLSTLQTVVRQEASFLTLDSQVDSPGFGDLLDNRECWRPVVDHIQERFQECLHQETRWVGRRFGCS